MVHLYPPEGAAPNIVYNVQFGILGTTTFSADSGQNLQSLPLPESALLYTDRSLCSLFMSIYLQISRNSNDLMAGIQECKTKTIIVYPSNLVTVELER